MTKEQVEKIYQLKDEGTTIRDIAKKLGMPFTTIGSFLKKYPNKPIACQFCGKLTDPQKGLRTKRFCSDSCRHKYWNHQRYHEEAFLVECVCEECGKPYLRHKNKKGKFCSLTCYRNNRHRFGKEYGK